MNIVIENINGGFRMINSKLNVFLNILILFLCMLGCACSSMPNPTQEGAFGAVVLGEAQNSTDGHSSKSDEPIPEESSSYDDHQPGVVDAVSTDEGIMDASDSVTESSATSGKERFAPVASSQEQGRNDIYSSKEQGSEERGLMKREITRVIEKEVIYRENWDDMEITNLREVNGEWRATVWRLPKTPGGNRTVRVSSDGNILEYRRGR